MAQHFPNGESPLWNLRGLSNLPNLGPLVLTMGTCSQQKRGGEGRGALINIPFVEPPSFDHGTLFPSKKEVKVIHLF